MGQVFQRTYKGADGHVEPADVDNPLLPQRQAHAGNRLQAEG